MTPTPQRLNLWRSLKRRGDILAISKISGLSYAKIDNTLRGLSNGKKSVEAISEFYKRRLDSLSYRWCQIKKKGDISEISQQFDVPYRTINNAIQGRSSDSNALKAIIEFYEVRSQLRRVQPGASRIIEKYKRFNRRLNRWENVERDPMVIVTRTDCEQSIYIR